MPPKVSSPASAAEGLEASLKYVLSTLKSCESIKPNWEEVAQENGIAYARNAAAKFREILKKNGLDIQGGRIFDLGNPGAPALPTSTILKTPKTPKKAKASTPRKRKADDSDDFSTPGIPAKKKKSALLMIKEDEDTTDSEEETPKKKKASMQPKCEDAAEED